MPANDAEEDGLLDLISEASVDPGLWTSVVERLADLAGSGNGFISRLNIKTGMGVAQTARLDPALLQSYLDYYGSINMLQIVEDDDSYRKNWRPIVLTDEDIVDRDLLIRSEYYNDFMKPAGAHSSMMIRLALEGDDIAAISLNRPERNGRFETADLEAMRRLQPHLIRAFKVGQKLAATADSGGASLATVLGRSRHGVFLVDGDCRVRFVNPAAERLVAPGDGPRVVGGVLTAANPEGARRLAELVGIAAATPAACRGATMALRTSAHRLPLAVTVTPMATRPASLFGRRTLVMVMVADLEAEMTAPEARLRDLFGLSRAESRVAMAMAAGDTPKEAAARLGLSFFTVRGHLVRIYEKTNTNRQADLARLLARVETSDWA
jgi:DNA-binding CsgD family transcriptional regulator/PAS domain-containing protein